MLVSFNVVTTLLAMKKFLGKISDMSSHELMLDDMRLLYQVYDFLDSSLDKYSRMRLRLDLCSLGASTNLDIYSVALPWLSY